MTGLGTNVASTQAVISLRSYMQPQGPTQQSIINSTTPDSFTADASAVLSVTVAASATNQAFNLATIFAAYTAPIFVSVADVSSPPIGFKITTSSGVGKMCVAPGFWLAYVADGATALPTIYLDNPSSTQELVVSLGVMTQ